MEKRHYPLRKPQRRETGDMAFGVQPVIETLKAGKEIERLFVQRELGLPEIIQLANERQVPVLRVPPEKLNQLTRKNHQGVVCFISPIQYVPLHNVLTNVFEEGKVPLLLILDRITDVRNFGAIARTAESAGAHAIIVPVRGSAQINADAMKTSSGALNYLPICREANLARTLEYLQQSGVRLIACTEKAESPLYDQDLTVPTAFIMGSEEDGISPQLLEMAAAQAGLPLLGKIPSLNVSAAAAIVLYECVRQRRAEG